MGKPWRRPQFLPLARSVSASLAFLRALSESKVTTAFICGFIFSILLKRASKSSTEEIFLSLIELKSSFALLYNIYLAIYNDSLLE